MGGRLGLGGGGQGRPDDGSSSPKPSIDPRERWYGTFSLTWAVPTAQCTPAEALPGTLTVSSPGIGLGGVRIHFEGLGAPETIRSQLPGDVFSVDYLGSRLTGKFVERDGRVRIEEGTHSYPGCVHNYTGER